VTATGIPSKHTPWPASRAEPIDLLALAGRPLTTRVLSVATVVVLLLSLGAVLDGRRRRAG